MSALMGAKMFREFLLDGGYYPESGMQSLPDTLGKRFEEFGGELRLSCSVKKIKVIDNKVTGVLTEKDGFIPSTYVISNCDARQTFLKLLGKGTINNKDFLNTLCNMIPSLSIFILYLGLRKSFQIPKPGVNMWLLSDYDLDTYHFSEKELSLDRACTMVRIMPNGKALLAFVNVPFKNKRYWDSNKEKFMENFIDRIEKHCIPKLSKHIVHKEAATPHTLYRYTRNYHGAAYGWACTPSQVGMPDLRKPSFITGLYLTGHWTTQGLGIPGVVYVGHDTAKIILRKRQAYIKNMLN
jgi:phytoene dehydrogenase-like protein